MRLSAVWHTRWFKIVLFIFFSKLDHGGEVKLLFCLWLGFVSHYCKTRFDFKPKTTMHKIYDFSMSAPTSLFWSPSKSRHRRQGPTRRLRRRCLGRWGVDVGELPWGSAAVYISTSLAFVLHCHVRDLGFYGQNSSRRMFFQLLCHADFL